MWPWEHAAAGYLLLSLGLRALGRRPPTAAGAAIVVVATQLPDLVDKSLSWGLGVFPTGYALGHSALVAVPVGLVALAAGVRTDRRRLSVAFVAGYWSHIVTDVFDPLRRGDAPLPGRALWPVVTDTPYRQDLGLSRGLTYLSEFLHSLATMDPLTLVVLYLPLPLGTVAVWILDGAPGLSLFARVIRE